MNIKIHPNRICAALLCLPLIAHGSGVVNECAESSLRAALAGGGTVTFACDGVISLTSTLVITNNTVFDGSGCTVTISGNNAVRVLEVNPGVNLDLINLSVANGWTNIAAGLNNYGTSRVSNCTFTNNHATEIFPRFGTPGEGGAIRNGGVAMLVVNRSTFVQNRASGTLTTSGIGGAIANYGLLLATNCTFYSNWANGDYYSGFGGAIYTEGFAVTNFVVNCTFAANHAKNGDGALTIGSPSLIVLNSIFASNTVRGVSGPIETAGGHNLSSDNSASFWGTGNQTNTDARLGPIGNYGGPVWTLPLLTGSPALDTGDNTGAPLTDQRGRARPYGAGIDIGAFESSLPYSIRGTVSGFTLYGEVAVSDGTNTVPTFNHGRFALDVFGSGTNTISPQSADYLFLPASRSVSVGPDQVYVNFSAYHWNTLSIEGIATNTAHLIYAGTNDVSRRLLVSTNLVQWQSVLTNTIGPEHFWEIWQPISGQSKQFFRTVSP